ncbi:unnamed protein product [Gemmata massiliana]|uniref:Uncharacterized protein n=1 Tax=Gemmata massiliana TaxID=1210884 RepID=A0A6P2CZE4_9BACT|nr:unnamed protein product [Gemmata massiliana]
MFREDGLAPGAFAIVMSMANAPGFYCTEAAPRTHAAGERPFRLTYNRACAENQAPQKRRTSLIRSDNSGKPILGCFGPSMWAKRWDFKHFTVRQVCCLALGRSDSNGSLQLPVFLAANNLKRFIPKGFTVRYISYVPVNGGGVRSEVG